MREDNDDDSTSAEVSTITFRGKRYSTVNALGAAVLALTVALTSVVNIGIEFLKPEPDISDRYYGRDGDRDRKASENGDADLRRDFDKEIHRLSTDLAALRQRVYGLENRRQDAEIKRGAIDGKIERLFECCQKSNEENKNHKHWPEAK